MAQPVLVAVMLGICGRSRSLIVSQIAFRIGKVSGRLRRLAAGSVAKMRLSSSSWAFGDLLSASRGDFADPVAKGRDGIGIPLEEVELPLPLLEPERIKVPPDFWGVFTISAQETDLPLERLEVER